MFINGCVLSLSLQYLLETDQWGFLLSAIPSDTFTALA